MNAFSKSSFFLFGNKLKHCRGSVKESEPQGHESTNLSDVHSLCWPRITLLYSLGKFPKTMLRTTAADLTKEKGKYTQKEGMIKETEHSRKLLKYRTHSLPWQPIGLRLRTRKVWSTAWVDSPAPGSWSKSPTLAFCFHPALTGFDPFFSVDQCAKWFTTTLHSVVDGAVGCDHLASLYPK